MCKTTSRARAICLLVLIGTIRPAGSAETLEQRLQSQSYQRLALDARQHGDIRRGALLFYQPLLACRQCHTPDAAGNQIGPDLTQWEQRPSDEELVRAILEPSHTIRKGFETTKLKLLDGRVLRGLMVDNTDPLVLRDATVASRLYSIPRREIEAIQTDNTSIMPQGLVNQLAGRQQFLDLVRFLFEIRDGGRERMMDLEPPAHLYATRPLPEYERHIDHAGLITGWDDNSLQRGEEVYRRVCMNCHGTLEHAGSLPTALRFAEGAFKNGSDPYSMYQTITRGFGMMLPQTALVPQQKYDVIHYIRETYLRPHNPSQYFSVTKPWLASLPAGDTRGPRPRPLTPWSVMDYGPTLAATYEIGADGGNFAYKGIAVRLDPGPGGISRGRHFAIFDHDTMRWAAIWSGTGFIDWQGILFNGRHAVHPRIVGQLELENRNGPGWADPRTESWQDRRIVGRDGKHYGPLPRDWAHYEGMVRDRERSVFIYRVGDTRIWDTLELATTDPRPVYARQLVLDPHSEPITVQIGQLRGACTLTLQGEEAMALLAQQPVQPAPAAATGGDPPTRRPKRRPARLRLPPSLLAAQARLSDGDVSRFTWSESGGRLRLTLRPCGKRSHLTIWLASLESTGELSALPAIIDSRPLRPLDISELKKGAPRRFADNVSLAPAVGDDSGPFAVDILTHPTDNPWLARMRFTGFDFLPDGDALAACTWDGDVWLVQGIRTLGGDITWQRIASGLFQPLGLKVVRGEIYVGCRNQIVRLVDLNGDGETDRYVSFNNDHQVTEHFHEFAMGLQVDPEGNFYYAKSARHALPALVPQHGTLLKVSADGSKTRIVARGFRAANGVCLNPEGSFLVTDQEGHWTPKNRINWVRPGGFYGNMMAYHDVTDSSDAAMELPVCWITNEFDRSPSELLWVPRGRWGPLGGGLLSLSYGYGKIYSVLLEQVQGQRQGVLCGLPVPLFPTGLLRGRFHPETGDLYLCGMVAWGSHRQSPGGLYRVRATGKAMHMPLSFRATRQGIALTWSDPLDRAAAEQAANWRVFAWDLKRSANYGSPHIRERRWPVERVEVSADGRTVRLVIPQIAPTWGLSIRCYLKDAAGRPLRRRLDGSIYHLSPVDRAMDVPDGAGSSSK